MAIHVDSLRQETADVVSYTWITLDTNRSLAGKQVNFEIELFGTVTT